MEETKTAKAITLYKDGRIKESLKIFKTFRLSFTKEQIRVLTIAYECYDPSKRKFYEQLNMCTSGYMFLAKLMISIKYKLYTNERVES